MKQTDEYRTHPVAEMMNYRLEWEKREGEKGRVGRGGRKSSGQVPDTTHTAYCCVLYVEHHHLNGDRQQHWWSAIGNKFLERLSFFTKEWRLKIWQEKSTVLQRKTFRFQQKLYYIGGQHTELYFPVNTRPQEVIWRRGNSCARARSQPRVWGNIINEWGGIQSCWWNQVTL